MRMALRRLKLTIAQAVKAAEEEKNKVREQRKRAAQEEILRLEQVPPQSFHAAFPQYF